MLDIIIDIIILTKLLIFTIISVLLQLLVPKKYILVDKQMAESDISSKDSAVGEGWCPAHQAAQF